MYVGRLKRLPLPLQGGSGHGNDRNRSSRLPNPPERSTRGRGAMLQCSLQWTWIVLRFTVNGKSRFTEPEESSLLCAVGSLARQTESEADQKGA